MKKTYTGSCHCGRVRYEADIDLSQGTFKCNCSICTKARNWITLVKPSDFRLLAGDDALSDYQFGAKSNHHPFCKYCGIRAFGWGESPELGGKFFAVNIACLDIVAVEELVSAPIAYLDGRNDNWQAAPKEVRHL